MKYFSYREFDSPDLAGTGEKMDPVFLMKLEQARIIAGIPFVITSGFRTQKHHEAIYKRLGKEPTRSAHLTGHAADIVAKTSGERWTIIQALIKAGFNRIGINKKSNFIHVDNSPNHSPNLIWIY